MQCSRCGKALPEGAVFCGGCGARVEVATPSVPPTPTPTLTPTPTPLAGSAPASVPVSPVSSAFDWGRVQRYDVGIVGAAFLAMIGLFLPWGSIGYPGFSVSGSGFSFHVSFWLSFLLLIAIIALSIVKVLVPTFAGSWPMQPVILGMAGLSTLIVLIGFRTFFSGVSLSIGPFWCVVMLAALLVSILTPMVNIRAFNQPLVAPSTRRGPAVASASPTAGAFCSSCGAPSAGSRFCSRCGAAL